MLLTPHFPLIYFIRILATLFVHKFAHHSNRLPVLFASYFTQNKLIHQHDTRDKCDFHMSTPCTTFGKISLKYKGSHTWNNLPESLTTIQSTSLFKHSLSVFLLTGVWSGITELCTFMLYAPCTLHCIAYYCYYIFTMGGQLRWALCLSGNPPLCFVAVIV